MVSWPFLGQTKKLTSYCKCIAMLFLTRSSHRWSAAVTTHNLPVYGLTVWIDITPPGPGNTDCSIRNASTSLAA